MAFLDRFIEEYSRNFTPTYQNVLNDIQYREIMDERYQREQQAKQQEQEQNQNIFQDLLGNRSPITNRVTGEKVYQKNVDIQPRGTLTEGNFRPEINVTDTPISPIQEMLMLSQLPANMQNLYFAYKQSQQPPPPQEWKTWTDANGNQYRMTYDPKTNSIVPGPLVSEKRIKPENISLGFEIKNGHVLEKKGYKDKDGNEVITDRQHLYKLTEKDNKGGLKISSGLKEIFKDRFKKQQDLTAKLNTVKQGIVVPDEYGDPITKEKLSEELNAFNREYSNLVDQSMPETSVEWYKQTWNEEAKDDNKNVIKKSKTNPHPQDYWDKLLYDYKNENISPLDFQILIEKGRSIYGFDLPTAYGFEE